MNNAVENTIRLYFLKSPLGINWSSVTDVARGIIKNYCAFKPRFMGHVFIELKGSTSNGEQIDILTGMVAKELPAKKLLFLKKIGMGIIYHSFKGHLETKKDVYEEVQGHIKDNERINYVTFKVSTQTLDTLVKYHQEYSEQNIGKYYGLYNRPLYKEGAGCSAFGASFLQLTNLMTPEIEKSWTHRLQVPLKYIGQPIQNKKVSFLGLMFGNKTWASQSEDSREIYFWDPDKMYNWVEELFKNNSNGYTSNTNEGVHSITKDVTEHKNEISQIWQTDNRELPLWEENTW